MKNTKELQFFPLPEHNCSMTNDGWAGRYTSLKLRQGILVNIIKVNVSKDQMNTYKSNASDSDHIVGCIVLKGQLQIKSDDRKKFMIEPRKFSMFPTQGLNFQVTAPIQEKLYLLTYSFPKKILKWSIKGRDSNVSTCLGSGNSARCRYFGIPVNREIHELVAEIMSSRLTGQLLKLYLEGAILQTLAHKIDQLEKLPPESDLLPPKSENEMLHDVHEYLLSDLMNSPTIKQMAAKVGMSEKRLSSGFRELFGTSAYATLLAKRMSVSKEKLEQEKLPLKKIAQSVGYKHVSNFISAFTKYYGIPPKAYTKHNK